MSDTTTSYPPPPPRDTGQQKKPAFHSVPARKGPPLCAIPEGRKQELDCMSDKDYMAVFMRMSEEEKESLMISEAERQRTYRSLWPNLPFLDYRKLAREGFYYTGYADRVQCAFCVGVLGNWEKGDDARQSHRTYFRHCKMARGKASWNIAVERCEDSEERHDVTSSGREDAYPSLLVARSQGIDVTQVKHPAHQIPADRRASYAHYSRRYPMSADELSEAGFFYERSGDKVRCFWCDGMLELWNPGDDAWKEHAKWYPGCSYVKSVKGEDFVRQCRSEMTPEELENADGLKYNSSDTDFLHVETGASDADMDCEETDSNLSADVHFDMGPVISEDADAIDYDMAASVTAAMTCLSCEVDKIGAALLPCGHLSICVICSESRLPKNCPRTGCNKQVKASIKVYLC